MPPQPDGGRDAGGGFTLPPPPAAPTEVERQPIGVPPGYVVERDVVTRRAGGIHDDQIRTITERRPQTPLYFEGEDWKPASYPPQRIIDLQRAMIDAGLIDPRDSIRLGVWDEVSRAAYRKLLGYANASGTDWRVALNNWKQAGDTFGTAGGAGLPPLQVKLSNPEDLKQVFRKAVIEQLGEGWDESKLDAMVASYQNEERRAQTEAHALAIGNEGLGLAGEVTPPPDPTTFASSQIESDDPVGADAYRGLRFQNEFFGMLRSIV